MTVISIILPIRNEEHYIISTLDALCAQNYPNDRYELIIVDGMSTDSTQLKVEQYISQHKEVNIRLLTNPGMLSSRARNIGISHAQGKLIAVIDGHVHLPSRELFSAMEHLWREKGALCLARPAPLVVPGMNRSMPYWIAVARKSWLGHSRHSYIYSDHEGWVDPQSSAFAYDSRLFERVGMFDENFDAAEDVEFHYRLKQAGVMAYTSPDLTIYSYPRRSLRSLFRQQLRYGVGRARFILKHPGGMTKETLIPAFITLFFLILPLMPVSYQLLPRLTAIYVFTLIVYFLMLFTAGIAEAISRKSFVPAVIIVSSIWVTHIGLGIGFIKELAKSFSINGLPLKTKTKVT